MFMDGSWLISPPGENDITTSIYAYITVPVWRLSWCHEGGTLRTEWTILVPWTHLEEIWINLEIFDDGDKKEATEVSIDIFDAQ